MSEYLIVDEVHISARNEIVVPMSWEGSTAWLCSQDPRILLKQERERYEPFDCQYCKQFDKPQPECPCGGTGVFYRLREVQEALQGQEEGVK